MRSKLDAASAFTRSSRELDAQLTRTILRRVANLCPFTIAEAILIDEGVAQTGSPHLLGGAWHVTKFRPSAGRGSPEVITDYFIANSALFFMTDGLWERFFDARRDHRGVMRSDGGTYEVVSEHGDRCRLLLHSDEQQTNDWSIVFRGPDKFEIIGRTSRDTIVMVRRSTPSLEDLRAEIARAAALEEDIPEVEIDSGLHEKTWGVPPKP